MSLIASQQLNFTKAYPKQNLQRAFTGAVNKSSNKKEENSQEYKNPVNKVGEYFNAISKSIYRAAGVSFRTFIHALACGAASDDDNPLIKAATVGLIVGAATFVFTLPYNIYKANIDFFRRKKEMDVFIRENSAEQKMYEQIDEKVKNGNKNQQENYMKVRMARSRPATDLKQNTALNQFTKGFFLSA